MSLRAKMELTEYAEGTRVGRCVSTVPLSEASGAHLTAMRRFLCLLASRQYWPLPYWKTILLFGFALYFCSTYLSFSVTCHLPRQCFPGVLFPVLFCVLCLHYPGLTPLPSQTTVMEFSRTGHSYSVLLLLFGLAHVTLAEFSVITA